MPGPDRTRCELHAAVPAPTNEILAAGARDPGIACALFRPVVADLYGAEFSPVVSAGACHFVRPELGLQIETAATELGEPPAVFDGRAPFAGRGTEISLAGRGAVTYRSVDSREFAVYASPYGDVNRYGHIRMVLPAVPHRGVVADTGSNSPKTTSPRPGKPWPTC